MTKSINVVIHDNNLWDVTVTPHQLDNGLFVQSRACIGMDCLEARQLIVAELQVVIEPLAAAERRRERLVQRRAPGTLFGDDGSPPALLEALELVNTSVLVTDSGDDVIWVLSDAVLEKVRATIARIRSSA